MDLTETFSSVCRRIMELPPLTRIRGVHAGSSLYHMNDGFLFSCCWQNGNNFNFRCSKWGSGCRATAVLRSGFFQSSLVHNHPSDPLRVPIQLERQRLVNEASNLQYATFADIFSNTRFFQMSHCEHIQSLKTFGYSCCLVAEFVPRHIRPSQAATSHGTYEVTVLANEANFIT